jgi:hypothetical protein
VTYMCVRVYKKKICWGEIVQEEKVCAGDPVHAGDKAVMWGTPAQRGSVNRPEACK